MPILSAFWRYSKSCFCKALLYPSALVSHLQHQLSAPRPGRRVPSLTQTMPQIEDADESSGKGKETMPPAIPPKHVHFERNGGASGKQNAAPPANGATPNGTASPGPGKAQAAPSAGKAREQTPPVDNQPSSFPQVGAPPNSTGQFGPGQWYTSADPRRSLSQQQQYQVPPLHGGYWPGAAAPGAPLFANGVSPGTHFYPAAIPPHLAAFQNICHPVFAPSTPLPPAPQSCPHSHTHHHHPSASCVISAFELAHLHSTLLQLAARWLRSTGSLAGTAAAALPNNITAAARLRIMADYHNAAPPPCGVNFQPPVPDTTFGTIPHVYVPRFDGPYAPGAQVGPPFLQFIHAPADPCPPSFTVLVPKTFYVDGYNYYASNIWKSAHLATMR